MKEKKEENYEEIPIKRVFNMQNTQTLLFSSAICLTLFLIYFFTCGSYFIKKKKNIE